MWDSKDEITMEQVGFRTIRYNSGQFSCHLTSIYRFKPSEKFHHIVVYEALMLRIFVVPSSSEPGSILLGMLKSNDAGTTQLLGTYLLTYSMVQSPS